MSPNTTSKRILILSVSAGSGHLRAAEALCAAAVSQPDVTALHLDVMDCATSRLKAFYTRHYLRLVRNGPELWRYLYRKSHHADPDGRVERVRRVIERSQMKELMHRIAAFAPDAVICTHFLPAELLSRAAARGEIDCPVWVQITDFDLHRMWVHAPIRGYFAPNDEVGHLLRRRGVAEGNVHVTGIPVMPEFAVTPDRAACAREAGLRPDVITVLFVASGLAPQAAMDAVAALLALDDPCQVIVLAGKDPQALALYEPLKQRYPQRLVVQGYTRRIDMLMGCADMVVSKAGGLTVSECLAMGVPMVLHCPILGQEERNADHVLEEGAGWKSMDEATLAYRIGRLLAQPELLVAMRGNARRLGRPHAAQTVLRQVLQDLAA